MKQVVITGMGAVTAAGIGAQCLWEAARDGVTGVDEFILDRTDRQHIRIAAAIPGFVPEEHLPPDRLVSCDRFSQIGLVAAREATAQAGLDPDTPQGERTAVIVGSGIGGATTNDDGHYNFYVAKGRDQPMTIPRVMPNAAASQISMRYGCRGPSFAVSSACSSSSQAIGLGFQMIRSGIVDRAIVGGSEAMLTPAVFRAWEGLRVLTPDACRPFSRGRNGMVLGEGAAIVVLESADAAMERGANALATLAGYGTTSDAADLVRPDVNGAARSMQTALDDAGIAPGEIGYINAHGTATILNDVTESAALDKVFGPRAGDVPVSSTKPIHGHTLGAAGAIEFVVTIFALREQTLPPTINWKEEDPKCVLDMIPDGARPAEFRAAMSNSFAFGGINASLVATPAS